MSEIVTIVVYDPNGKHSSASLNQATKIFSNTLDLYNFLSSDSQIYRSVGICSNDKSEVIDKIVHLPQVTSIFLCPDKEHCDCEKNPLHHDKVRDEISFKLDEDDLFNLEFHGHIKNRENCLLYNSPEQLEIETQALIRTKNGSKYRTHHPHQPEEPNAGLSSAEFQTSNEAKK